MTDSSMNDFIIANILGKGSFSTVSLVRRKEDKKIYALKSVILEKLNKKEQQNSVNEVRILASVNHPNVIGYKEAFWDDVQNTLNIVMEYADDGDLQTKITKMRKEGGMFQEDLIWSYSIQMIEGLKALHDKKIMHRDLKSANIFLVKDKYQCKIGDMNVSKVIKEKELLTQTGTPYYASPEVWRDEPYSYKSDLWSIGCVIYELCSLRPPFKGKDLDELFMNVCKGKVERINRIYSDDLWTMILMLLKVNVQERCDCDKFLNSRLITRKIQEMKKQNKDYKNLEKNKEINDGDLLDTIRFDNILDIKRQLPTKKNYSNNKASLSPSSKNKKLNKKRNSNISNNSNNNNSNNLIEPFNSVKYRKINNKNRKVIYNSKNVKTVGKNIPFKTEVEKENNVDLERDSHLKNEASLNPQESGNSITNIEKKINSNLKNALAKKFLKNVHSPKVKNTEGNSMIYQKPKLFEKSVKRNKKNIYLNNKKPMTTKRTTKQFNYIERNISPQRTENNIVNKSEIIPSMNEKHVYSMRNKNIYNKEYSSLNKDINQKIITKQIETSPGNYNSNHNRNIKYLNIIKKKNTLHNDMSQRPQSTTPSIKSEKIYNTTNNIVDSNVNEVNIDLEKEITKNIPTNKEVRSYRDNVVTNSYNKKNINFNSYNPNSKLNKNKVIERPLTTTNNSNIYNKRPILSQQYDKNPPKFTYNKVLSKQKTDYNKKKLINKNLERDMTEPELLKNSKIIKSYATNNQRTLNISLNNQEKKLLNHPIKQNKIYKYNTNNNSKISQNYLNNSNSNTNQNPQIFNNYVSINNLVAQSFPFGVINVYGEN